MKLILLGIGSPLNGDDGIGTLVAKKLEKKKWLNSIPCETVPENFAGVIRRELPDIVILVDAAEMGLESGQLRLVPKEKLNSIAMGTHGIPLKHLVSELEESAKQVIFIGVQPETVRFGERLSPAVKKSGQKLVEIIKQRGWSQIEKL